MNKRITFSMCLAISMYAKSFTIDPIDVKEKINTKILKDVKGHQIKSADLGEALSKNVPSVSLSRRSGISNDIILRGQKRDNINIIIDNAKIYGACPNRMDPPISHIATNNIENIQIEEGPYDVRNFGTLSGLVKVNTKEPEEGTHGDINLNIGSYDYQKESLSISAGTKNFKILLSGSNEKSGQYKDSDGNTLAQQTKNKTSVPNQYQEQYFDMDAYKKKTFLSKIFWNVTDNQDLKFSYSANRSDNVMYPNTGMDAIKDDSDIYDFLYTFRDLGKYSKELSFNYYYSKVEHPMSTKYRNKATNPMMGEMINDMNSKIDGGKIINEMDLKDSTLVLGLDTSNRQWDGKYYTKTDVYLRDSISKTNTKNKAAFLEYEKTIYDKYDVEFGLRYDDTSIDTQANSMKDRDYDSVSANIFTTYQKDFFTKYFLGFGKAVRVPDARELYFVSSNGSVKGNDDLNETTNYEVDLGFEKIIDSFKIKTKLFYSILDDYIYYNDSIGKKTFENVDASIYGVEFSGFYYLNDLVSFDYALSYQRGKKKNPLEGQSGTNLADIPPLKGSIGLNYEKRNYIFNTSVQAANSWDKVDEENGEQKLAGYAVWNFKYNYKFPKGFDITFGMDNILDKTYAVSNTYSDLTLVSTGSNESMLLNEPGRYTYLNFRYSF